MFVVGLWIFGAASLAAALSPNPAFLIGARALLAVGAAAMMPATLALIRLAFDDPRERNIAIAIWGEPVDRGGSARTHSRRRPSRTVLVGICFPQSTSPLLSSHLWRPQSSRRTTIPIRRRSGISSHPSMRWSGWWAPCSSSRNWPIFHRTGF
ncbi:hypothetical protein [Micrococcus sp. CH3]|uniref:hypothetical protein n=1 Tax=Micrococcus sp. CH3 TaxID=1770209 RepID=UPI001E5318DC|nr:hypothetical protein [Micrococcus sp. CH3]